MKNLTVKVLLCAICVFMVGFAFTGCDLQDFSLSGKSAYEIAVENGFEGTQAEWLESLKGEPGEYAGQGKSAYEIAVENGFEGTQAEWLASLNTFEDVYKINMNKCLTSVVSIEAKSGTSGTKSTGSGVIMEYKRALGFAYVVTNFHVVCDSNTHALATNISCFLYGREYSDFPLTTTCIGYSPENDIAVLKVYISNELFDSTKVTTAVVGNSAKLEVGQSIGAIGNSKGSGIALTRGIISVDSEYTSFSRYDGGGTSTVRVMRFDAYIVNGNSGGGLFNVNGELIGIVNATSTSASFYYAIPINLAYGIYKNIVEHCTAIDLHADKIGLGIRVASADSIAVLDEDTQTVYIKEVVKINYIETSAMSALFNEGDEFVSVTHNGVLYQINRTFELSELMWQVEAGDTLKFKVKRSGVIVEVNVSAQNYYNGVNNNHTSALYDRTF